MERKLFLESSYRGARIWSHKKLVDTSRSTAIYLESTAVRSTRLTTGGHFEVVLAWAMVICHGSGHKNF